MLERARTKIALEFTLITFALLVTYGLILIPIDYRDQLNALNNNITQDAIRILPMNDGTLESVQFSLSERDDFRTRIFSVSGALAYDGELFAAEPDQLRMDPMTVRYHNDFFRVLTFPIDHNDVVIGYLQIGEVHHPFWITFWQKGFIVILESAIVSLLIFFLGQFFATRTLQPAIAMQKRLEQFSQDASHELKTPIATANSALDLALKDTEQSEAHIHSAKKALHKASILVEKLLQLAKLTSFSIHLEEIDCTALMKEVAEEFREYAKKEGIKITANIAEDILVRADRSYLKLLTENLVHNAIKFSNADGEVALELTQATLTVRDKGIGIAKEKLDRIFDPFFQADSSRATKGYGLGLSIVKKIVDAHGWYIDAESTQNMGTAFHIHFKG